MFTRAQLFDGLLPNAVNVALSVAMCGLKPSTLSGLPLILVSEPWLSGMHGKHHEQEPKINYGLE